MSEFDKIIEDWMRLCTEQDGCDGCSINFTHLEKCGVHATTDVDLQAFKQAVEKWRVEHPTPIQHGHWIYLGHCRIKCSECHHIYVDAHDMENADNYCRFCGAKMDE